MVRPTSDLSALQDLDIEICHGDISDIDSVKAAMNGCGTVFYNVVDTRAWLVDSAPLYRTNVDGLANVLDAAVAENITRFVFTSSMVTLPRHSGSPALEEHAFDWWDEAPDYVKTRVLAEKAVADAVAERGLPAVMLCVANTYGPEDHGPTPHGNALWQATKSKSTALDCSLTDGRRPRCGTGVFARGDQRAHRRALCDCQRVPSTARLLRHGCRVDGIRQTFRALHAQSLCLRNDCRSHQSSPRDQRRQILSNLDVFIRSFWPNEPCKGCR